MSKTLAIKGRETQGIEVIKLLEMMGGKNCFHLHGLFSEHAYYFIGGPRNDEIRAGEYIFDEDDMCFFTLEEFWEKFPFKVGDRVRIPEYESEVCILKMKWCPLSEHIEYLVCPNDEDEWFTTDELLEDNDNPIKEKPKHMKNVLAELLDHIKTTPKEELEKEFKEIEEWSNVGPTVEEFMAFCESVNKKPKYPTTYMECSRIMNVGLWNTLWGEDATEYEKQTEDLINTFIKLKVCRDAYWKIAGEEMGLGKPWAPDWNTKNQERYVIVTNFDKFFLGSSTWGEKSILAFPTVEMRDAFYENFKDLIENCNELL